MFVSVLSVLGFKVVEFGVDGIDLPDLRRTRFSFFTVGLTCQVPLNHQWTCIAALGRLGGTSCDRAALKSALILSLTHLSGQRLAGVSEQSAPQPQVLEVAQRSVYCA